MKHSGRTQAERSAATRTALIGAGRRLFAEHGFAGVGTEAIVHAADASRGALYHHFADKTELFAAVLDDVERQVAEQLAAIVRADASSGFVDVMLRSVEAWLDACERPEVQRIVLVDGPSVLGWKRWREICQPHILGLVSAALTQGMADGSLDPQPVTPLAHLLLAVADEAAMYVVTNPDPAAARRDIVTIVRRLLESLTTRSGQGRFVLDQPGGNLALDLFVLSQHVGSMLEVAFTGTGVTPAQYAVYSQLGAHPVTPRQLGQTLGLAPATVSNHLNAIERRGHLARTPSATDRRSHTLALTPTGVTKWHECRERLRVAIGELNTQIGSAAERTALRETLGRIDDAILDVTQRAADRAG